MLLLCLLGASVFWSLTQTNTVCLAQSLLHGNDDDYAGWTCLHYAAARGDDKAIDRLLTRDTPVDPRNSLGRTPLMVAAKNGALGSVDQLLGHGANVNAHDQAGFTALHLAAQELHAAVVRRFLRADARVNAQNKWQQTPLWLVAKQTEGNNTVIAHSLISNGAKVNTADAQGNTPLHMAARAGRYRMVKYLLTVGASVDPSNRQEQTPLYLAVIGNSLRSARILLRHGADPDVTSQGRSALEMASNHVNRNMANLLAAYGADGHTQSK